MSQAMTRTDLGWDEYLEWEARQPSKYELVDGRVQAMTGGTIEHDTICNNLRFELIGRLRNSACRVQGPDLKLRTGLNARYPDVFIDCGVPIRGSLLGIEPVAVFEVLSKSTAWIDQTLKLRDYDRVASIRSYVLINQDEPRVLLYTRDADGSLSARNAEILEGLDQVLTLVDPAITIPLQALYVGVDLTP